MQLSRLLSVIALSSAVAFACTTTKIPLASDDGVKVDKVIHVYGDQLIAKKNKYAVKTYIVNLHDRPVVFRLNEVQCFRGKEQGVIGYSTFGIGERTIDFAAGQQKQFNFACAFGAREPVGPFKIVITRVYENLSGDRVTPGRVLKENIVWNIHDGAVGN